MVKRFGRDRRGNHKQAVGDTALGTVRGFVHDLERVLTFRLTAVGHRAAAIKMSGVDAAEIQHDLCLLHQRQADRFRFLVAVSGEKDHLAIRGDANGLTGIFLCIVLICIGKHDLVVIYKHLVDAECFLNVALIGFVFTGIADLHCAVFENRKICGFLTTRNIVAVHDKYAGGLTGSHVVVRGVDTRHYGAVVIRVACRRFLIKSRYLFGKLGHAVYVIVHILIRGEKFDRIDCHINRCGEHLYLFTVFIVNSIAVLRDALCKG